MKQLFLFFLSVFILTLNPIKSYATHGLPIVGLTGTIGGSGLTISGGSDAATCGSGPYWMQVEIVCTPGGLTGTPPTTLQTTLASGAGGATTFNSFPWFNSLLNLPGYTAANGWSDGCVTGEMYNNIFIPFSSLCPGQTYYWAAREWVSASNSPGPWSAVQSFVCPGTFVPINFNIAASPATFCAPGSSTLSATSITGGCGTQTVKWSTGATTPSIVVTPAATTVYQCTVSAPCQTLVKSVTVTVVSALSAAFTPTNPTLCTGSSQVFTHTGTAGVNHNWAVSPATGVTISTPTSTNPSITFANAGSYVVSHTVTAGTCTNVVSTNVTVVAVTSPFTIPTATQCLTGNSFSFNNTGTAGGTHSYSFTPSTGAPAVGGTANYSGSFTAAGTYTVTHTVVSGGCTSVTTNTVVVNPMPSATLSFTNPNCGASNGVVVITNTSPGAPPQTVTSFASSLGTVSGQTVTGLSAGTPVITLTNNFGCTFTVSATLSSASGPTSLPLTPNNIICGTGTGSITIGTVTGGTAPYTYNVNGGTYSTTPPVTGLASGTYTVGVKDANGCTFTNVTTISVTSGPTAIAGTATPAGCSATNGSYNITGVTGGTPAYSFSVDAIATSSLTSNLAPGTHTVSVKDANGCIFNTTFVVGGTAGPTSATVATTNASCGSSNGSATVTTVTGGAGSNQFSFDGGPFSSTNNISGLAAGTHTVIIKDVNTCTLVVTFNISNTGSPTASVTNTVNISCFGGTNGSFTVTPVGGTAPYTYTLTTPFQTNGTGFFTGLPQGTYNVTVKDQAGCITTTSVTLTQPTQVAITPTAINVKCFGTATGTINVVGLGGTPAYSYNLNGGAYQVSTTFANQFAGTYLMGVKDANGCTATQSVVIAQPSALAITVSSQNANCTAANGVGSSTVTGGTGPITYSWTPTGGAAAISNSVAAGNYTVTATDANGCIISSPVLVGLTPGGTATITSKTNVTCNGSCNGSMTAGMIGGSAPFTYSWSPGGQTNSTATNLCPGTYTCEITDFYGCKSTAIGIITQPPILSSIMNSNNVKCYGTSTGTVTAAGTGGTGPYTYLWPQIPSTLASVSNVPINTYSCIITDFNGCSITSTISVTQPSSITLTSSVTAANCNLSNGSASVTISGGSMPYTQIWSATGSTTTVQSGVPAGTYTINVQDANTCTVTLAATIPNLSGPTISITSQTNVSCFNGNNGVATALATSGSGPYVYSWSYGSNSPTATNLTAGVYTVSATDQAGCVASTSVSITQPTALTVTIVPSNPKCFGASNGGGLAAAAGGVAPYTYAWTSTGGANATSNPLPAGNYGLTVTDFNGCIVTSSMSLVNPLAMSASITSTNVTCFGLCNGVAIASSTNGIGAVNYYWTGTPSPVSSQTLIGVCAGSYTVLATDQNSCTASAQITITEPTQVTANITSTGSVTCNGGNNGFAVVTPGGGTGPHSYTWTPSGGNTANANNLIAGSYVVTVSDVNSCVATATAVILQPTPLATTLTTTNPKCNGICDGTANIAYLGGAGTTSFLWQPGLQSGNTVNNLCAGNHTVTITSNGSCTTSLTFTLTEPAALTAVASSTNSNCGQANGKTCVVVAGGTSPYNGLWSNGVTTLCNNNVVAGPYTFTVTDANGCTAVAIGNINDIAGPLVSITGSTPVKCFGGTDGTATATITGGVSPYTISWTGSQAGPNTTTNPTNFGSGAHAVTVVDNAGCVGTASVNITEPTQIVSAIGSFTNVTCFGLSNGGATVLVNGGTTPYNYTWTPGVQTGSVLVNVPANTYSVSISDANGCLTAQQVIISQPQALVMTASSFTNITCFGANNGQISTTVQGGNPGYSYVWSPVITPPGGYVSGLAPGTYSLQVTDASSCSINANFTITEPSVLTSTYTSLPATCGLSNGSATVSLGGGTPSYNVVWNTPGTPSGVSVSGISPGIWTANISDSKGCTITQTVNVANPPVPVISGFVTNQPKCFGLANGDITINYSSGLAPYTIVWSNPISQTITTSAFTSSVSGISAGAYTATLTDSYGCSTSQPVSVSQPNMLVLIPSADVTICYGQSTQLNAAGSGGTPAYTYSWTPNTFVGGGPHTVNPTTTTSYIVSLSDANGCSRPPQIITVSVSAPLTAVGSTTTLCHGSSTVLAPNITSAGNGGPYTYNWTPAAGNTNSVTIVGNAPSTAITNTYAVSISDGCSVPNALAIFTVNVNPLPVVSFSASVLNGCAPLTLTLTGISDGASDSFTWGDIANGQGNPKVVTIQDSGLYSVSMFVVNPITGCRKDTTRIDYIEVYPQPIASFYSVPSSASILDPNFDFINTSQGATSYYWDFGDPAAINGSNNSTVLNPSHGYSYVGEYKVNLLVTSNKGCTDIASLLVEVTPDFALYIPNAFTPDENGKNDIFLPMGVGIDEDNYRMDIFDRWGENIFTSNNFRKGWDGSVKGGSKPAPQGVYIYKLQVVDTKGNKHPYVGHVTVIRQNQ